MIALTNTKEYANSKTVPWNKIQASAWIAEKIRNIQLRPILFIETLYKMTTFVIDKRV
jgi:hypothetical protein